MRIGTFITAAGVAVFGTLAVAQTVNYDFDRGADFGRYRTYAWTRGTELADQLNHARVMRSIETQLGTKGLSKVDANGSPDLLVAYHTSFEKNLQINAWSSGYGLPRFGGLQSGTATTQQITTGTLVVDLIDAGTKHIVWRGFASGDLDPSAKPDKREKTMNKATAKLFKNYPPKP